MKTKIMLTLVLLVLFCGMTYAQDANTFAAISFEKGGLMYHGKQVDIIGFGGLNIKSSDISEFSSYQNGSDTIVVIKTKNNDMVEYSQRLVKFLYYTSLHKQLLVVF